MRRPKSDGPQPIPKSKAQGCVLGGSCNLPLLLIAGLLLASAPSWAQPFSMDWYNISGGGGTSTGGAYSISGTIGQPDAGAMSGGNFTLQGGFWSVTSIVPTPGAPTLTVTHAGNSVIISWPYPSVGFVLQQNAVLANPAAWSAYGGTVSTNNGVNSITFTSPAGSVFYRLRRP